MHLVTCIYYIYNNTHTHTHTHMHTHNGEIDITTIIVRDFNTSISIVGRSNRQINKVIKDLCNMLNKLKLIDNK